jgi:hypothetical protein
MHYQFIFMTSKNNIIILCSGFVYVLMTIARAREAARACSWILP